MFNKLRDKARDLKTQLSVLMIAYKDKRTPLLSKILIGFTVGYMLSPIDLIPDFIPVVGLLDDLLIVPLLIAASIKLIPKGVLADAKSYAEANSSHIKKSNWIFGIFFIIIWLLLTAIILIFLFKKN